MRRHNRRQYYGTYVRFAHKATEVVRRCNMSRWAIGRHRAHGARNADALAKMHRFIAVAACEE
jgi:hypothetical protein